MTEPNCNQTTSATASWMNVEGESETILGLLATSNRRAGQNDHSDWAFRVNTATVDDLRSAVLALASPDRPRDARLASIAKRQAAEPGPLLAFRALAARPSSTSADIATGSDAAAR
jgi:hypothetical protein